METNSELISENGGDAAGKEVSTAENIQMVKQQLATSSNQLNAIIEELSFIRQVSLELSNTASSSSCQFDTLIAQVMHLNKLYSEMSERTSHLEYKIEQSIDKVHILISKVEQLDEELRRRRLWNLSQGSNRARQKDDNRKFINRGNIKSVLLFLPFIGLVIGYIIFFVLTS
jgi:chaperonin cofactor prefoldin